MGRYLDKAREVKAQQSQSEPTNSDALNALNALSPAASPVVDGELPPLDRPPENQEELVRLLNHLADPVSFAGWFQHLMEQADPAELN
jgi:hypothetical protein